MSTNYKQRVSLPQSTRQPHGIASRRSLKSHTALVISLKLSGNSTYQPL